MDLKLYTLLLLFVISVSSLFSQSEIVVTDDDLQGGQNYSWTSNNTYLLDGFVFLEAGGTLVIEPGTVIKGLAVPSTGDNASALIITRGARIIADGTAQQPIIFTSEIDDVNDPSDLTQDDRGLWGGLIVLGEGVIARPGGTDQIEGIPSDETRAEFGGNNDADDSGVLRYVSIRHGGAELAPGDEINGLTLGGVGSGTTIEFVEIFANQDDGIEWFGGTVDVKNLIVAFCGDDGTDYDFGYRGRGQYWFVIQDPNNAGNAGEHDGANPDGQDPFSNPTIYNATYIGAGIGAAADNEFALLFRDRAAGTYANSIFTDFKGQALSVEDLPPAEGADSYENLINGDLVLTNNLWFGFGAGTTLQAIVDTYPDGNDPDASDVISHLTNNSNQLVDPLVCSISRNADGMLDPRVENDSPAAGGAIAPSDSFFDNVSYQGAFGTADTENWANGWSALSSMGYLGSACTTTDVVNMTAEERGFVIEQNRPNPAVSLTTVNYQLPIRAVVSMNVYDLQGRMVKQLITNELQGAGEYSVEFNVNDLQKGIYFISLESSGMVITRKMVVVR